LCPEGKNVILEAETRLDTKEEMLMPKDKGKDKGKKKKKGKKKGK
jgi:hypothetical protein